MEVLSTYRALTRSITRLPLDGQTIRLLQAIKRLKFRRKQSAPLDLRLGHARQYINTTRKVTACQDDKLIRQLLSLAYVEDRKNRLPNWLNDFLLSTTQTELAADIPWSGVINVQHAIHQLVPKNHETLNRYGSYLELQKRDDSAEFRVTNLIKDKKPILLEFEIDPVSREREKTPAGPTEMDMKKLKQLVNFLTSKNSFFKNFEFKSFNLVLPPTKLGLPVAKKVQKNKIAEKLKDLKRRLLITQPLKESDLHYLDSLVDDPSCFSPETRHKMQKRYKNFVRNQYAISDSGDGISIVLSRYSQRQSPSVEGVISLC